MFRVRVAFIVTAPVPRFRSPVPAKMKSPFQFWMLLLVSVLALPLVLSIVPPLILKTLAVVPRALSLLMASYRTKLIFSLEVFKWLTCQ
jgi:hypothetical protein